MFDVGPPQGQGGGEDPSARPTRRNVFLGARQSDATAPQAAVL